VAVEDMFRTDESEAWQTEHLRSQVKPPHPTLTPMTFSSAAFHTHTRTHTLSPARYTHALTHAAWGRGAPRDTGGGATPV
jgi:hypothetical protein